jgi:hypothetical protein
MRPAAHVMIVSTDHRPYAARRWRETETTVATPK